MQSSLRAFFAGRREAVELPPKRGPGRPKKEKAEAKEAPDVEVGDVVLEEVKALSEQPSGFEADLLMRRTRRGRPVVSFAQTLAEATGKASAAEVRCPQLRKKIYKVGPQKNLALCEWLGKFLYRANGKRGFEVIGARRCRI